MGACAKASAMKLNGGFTATVAGILLTSSIGGAAYLARQVSATAERLAIVETKLAGIESQLNRIIVLQTRAERDRVNDR